MMRLEFWKAAIGIIKAHPLTGVGTGDMPQAYQQEYKKMNTKLDEKYRVRAHNQFLAIAVALGIPAALYFFFALLFPGISTVRIKDIFYLAFILIAIISMLAEDTLETQAGATFFAFFNAMLLFGRQSHRTTTPS
jgi:O-antigen ligase